MAKIESGTFSISKTGIVSLGGYSCGITVDDIDILKQMCELAGCGKDQYERVTFAGEVTISIKCKTTPLEVSNHFTIVQEEDVPVTAAEGSNK